MSRRSTLVLLGLVLAFATSSSGALGATPVSVIEAGNASFPDRAFVLSTPTPIRLDRSAVSVLENGRRVEALSVVPAQLAGKGAFGVVLVLDASASMLGKPIAGAVDAARAFASKRAPNEQLGIVTFNRRVRTSLALSTDTGAITQALARSPRLAVGTHIYDGLAAAISLLRRSKLSVASIVLLSDGTDTGSALHASQVLARASAAHVRIFTIGLRSHQFSPGTLRRLSAGTGAVSSSTGSTAALAPIFEALSTQLSNDYLVAYKSLAGPDALVRVRIRLRGIPGFASVSYRTPALPIKSLPPFHRSFLKRFWLSSGSSAVVALIAGLLAAIALVALLSGSRYRLRKRVQRFVSVMDRIEVTKGTGAPVVASLEGALERRFVGTPRWKKLVETLEIADFPLSAARLVLLTAALSIALAFISAVALPVVFVFFGLGGPPLAARILVGRKLKERRDSFSDQLPDNLSVLAAALRVGHSFIGALSVMIDEAAEPARSEFRRALSNEQLGVLVEDALLDVADRMDSDDLKQVALVAALQRQTGGNTAEVLDTVVETIHERREIRRIVRTMTTQGRAAQWVLSILPVALLALLTLINPSYMSPLYHTTTGEVLLVMAAILVVSGSVIIQRIVDIKV
jgi:tight adherence protein B